MASEVDNVMVSPEASAAAQPPPAPIPVTAVRAAPAGEGAEDPPDPFCHMPHLSEAQNKALAALALGKGATRAAIDAGVNRNTIYRWQHRDPQFAAAVNILSRQTREHFFARLANMNGKCVSALEQLLVKNDFRAIKLIFSFMEKQRIGPGTPSGIQRRLTRVHEKAARDSLDVVRTSKGTIPMKMHDELIDNCAKHLALLKNLEMKMNGKT